MWDGNMILRSERRISYLIWLVSIAIVILANIFGIPGKMNMYLILTLFIVCVTDECWIHYDASGVPIARLAVGLSTLSICITVFTNVEI
tara:strand:+ start:86493 stop:86759 length:267 start_codon:yes stop_codon:yes gene_type:complete